MITRNVSMVSGDHRKCLRIDYAMLRVCDSIIKWPGNLCYWSLKHTRFEQTFEDTSTRCNVCNERQWTFSVSVVLSKQFPHLCGRVNQKVPNRNSKFWIYHFLTTILQDLSLRRQGRAVKTISQLKLIKQWTVSVDDYIIGAINQFSSWPSARRWFMFSSLLCLHCMSPGS